MKALCLILCSCALVAEGERQPSATSSKGSHQRAAGLEPLPKFRPASYKGIRFGASKRADLEKIFGPPMSGGLGENGGLYLNYKDIGVVPGKAQFILNAKTLVVEELALYPGSPVHREEARRLFAADFVLTRWKFANCLDDGGAGPIFRSADGNLVYLYAPGKGLALQLEADHVIAIVYLSKPLGTERDPCKGKLDPWMGSRDGSAQRK